MASKLAKSAKLPPPKGSFCANGSAAVGSGLGEGRAGAARITPGLTAGLGGAGRGGGFAFFGGRAGLGLSGRGGGPALAGCSAANGSQPKASLFP